MKLEVALEYTYQQKAEAEGGYSAVQFYYLAINVIIMCVQYQGGAEHVEYIGKI
jgi:hypothetical protein